MVQIVDYKNHLTDEGKDFFVLVIQGGLELVKSKQTGKYYATIRKATIPTTFDESTCKSLIGSELPGSIQKIETASYDYTIKDTGEVIQLTHKWMYLPEESTPVVEKSDSTIDDFVTSNKMESFSMNGVE